MMRVCPCITTPLGNTDPSCLQVTLPSGAGLPHMEKSKMILVVLGKSEIILGP